MHCGEKRRSANKWLAQSKQFFCLLRSSRVRFQLHRLVSHRSCASGSLTGLKQRRTSALTAAGMSCCVKTSSFLILSIAAVRALRRAPRRPFHSCERKRSCLNGYFTKGCLGIDHVNKFSRWNRLNCTTLMYRKPINLLWKKNSSTCGSWLRVKLYATLTSPSAQHVQAPTLNEKSLYTRVDECFGLPRSKLSRSHVATQVSMNVFELNAQNVRQ